MLATETATKQKKALASRRSRYLKRLSALQTERSTWDAHWRELADYILPRRSRFLTADRNKGGKRNDKLINPTATHAARVLASGMMAGITSPARRWFRLTLPNSSVVQSQAVKAWLAAVEDVLLELFAKSNFYNGLADGIYPDLGVYGTAACILEEDDEDVIRMYPLPIGSYYLATSYRGQVNTIFRELQYTVAQLVERFGLENCSQRVQEQHANGDLEAPIDVIHVIETNKELDYNRADYRGMPWRSCWFEKSGDDSTGFLAEKGYREFPVLAPRWSVTAEDSYGASPGMDALGSCKAIQLIEKRRAQVVDFFSRPPMVGPTSLQNASLLPGAVNHIDGMGKFEPAYVPPPQALATLDGSVSVEEHRINQTFYADLWLLLTQSDRREVTAEEVRAKQDEKMLQLAPVLERLSDELLTPAVERTLHIAIRRGLVPEIPAELEGADLKVEFISILAQAQKILGISGIEKTVAFVGSLAAVDPNVVDVLDTDMAPDIFRPQDERQSRREERAKASQAQAQGEASLAAVQGAKTLSETDMSGSSLLNQLMPNVTGAGGLVQ
jgi:hypothetical protein